MKRFLPLLQFLVSICFFTARIVHGYGPGTTMSFSPPLKNGIAANQFTAYNSQDNQFFFTWLSGASEINFVTYDTAGNVVVSQTTISAGSSSAPTAAYNSTDNQYLVSWIGGTVGLNFSILSNTGTSITLASIPLPADLILNGDPICCYNSTDNQYCITWTAFNTVTSVSSTYFVIVNADGSIAYNATAIPSVSGQNSANFTDSFVTYNAQNNQYLFTWLSTAGGPNSVAFALYGADGNVIVPAQIIPQDSSLNTNAHPPFSSYNSNDNQYFITWASVDTGGIHGFFAIYNHSGVALVPATEIATTASFFSTPVCSYNARNNQYLVSWNDSYTQALCSIFDASGNIVSSDIVLPLLLSNQPSGIVFNSLSLQDDTYFITWYSVATCAYFNLFTTSPSPAAPTNLKAINGTNRFINFVDYTTELTWTKSSSDDVSVYTVYRNGILLATLPAYATSYTAHNKPLGLTTYAVQAVNSFGDASALVTITV